MSLNYVQDKNFKSIDFNITPSQPSEFDNCTFNNCIFTGVNLSDFIYEECVFEDCDFSNAKITNTAFKSVEFNNCKLIGLQFDECNPFLLSFRFKACQLNLSAFFKLKIKGTFFKDCLLHEVDFTETELSSSAFNNCDLSGALFSNTNLEKTDFRTAYNFTIDPETNRIKQARFARENLSGLLLRYNIKIE